jgi:hypothetical protein
LHDVLRRYRPEVTDAARGEWGIIGQHSFAEECLGDGGAEAIGAGADFGPCAQRSLTDENGDAVPVIQDTRGLS